MADLRELCWRAFRVGHKEDALTLLLKVEQPDSKLVHLSAYRGWKDVCRQLVENYNLSPTDKADVFGIVWRPLHWACEYNRVEVVKYLLTFPSVLLTVNERDGGGLNALEQACYGEHLSLIEVLVNEPSVHIPCHLHSEKFSVLSLLSRIISGSIEYRITPYFPVFMAGNTVAGKTTLTKAILQLTQYRYSIHGREIVTGVKTLTAGICPSQCSG